VGILDLYYFTRELRFRSREGLKIREKEELKILFFFGLREKRLARRCIADSVFIIYCLALKKIRFCYMIINHIVPGPFSDAKEYKVNTYAQKMSRLYTSLFGIHSISYSHLSVIFKRGPSYLRSF
jgi:hypothetical protein